MRMLEYKYRVNQKESADHSLEELDHGQQSGLSFALQLQGELFMGLLYKFEGVVLLAQGKRGLKLGVSLIGLLQPGPKYVAEDVQVGAADGDIAQTHLRFYFAFFHAARVVVAVVQPGVGHQHAPLHDLFLKLAQQVNSGEIDERVQLDTSD